MSMVAAYSETIGLGPRCATQLVEQAELPGCRLDAPIPTLANATWLEGASCCWKTAPLGWRNRS